MQMFPVLSLENSKAKEKVHHSLRSMANALINAKSMALISECIPLLYIYVCIVCA